MIDQRWRLDDSVRESQILGALGGRGEKLKAWIQLSVLSPNRKLSNKLPITLACAP